MDKQKFDKVAYDNAFISNNYDRINLTVPKGEKAKIAECAKSHGESTNGFINRAIKDSMKISSPEVYFVYEEVNEHSYSDPGIEIYTSREEALVDFALRLYMRDHDPDYVRLNERSSPGHVVYLYDGDELVTIHFATPIDITP